MRWDDYPADLQLKECWLVAAGTEPLLLVQANKAQSSSVAVLEEPPGSRARKVWRFRFTYAVPEGSHVPFTAALKCKAGLQVGVAPPSRGPRGCPRARPHFGGSPATRLHRHAGDGTPGPQSPWVRGSPAPSPWDGGTGAVAAGQGCPRAHPNPPRAQNNTIFEKVLEVTVKDVWRPPNSEFGAEGGLCRGFGTVSPC